MSTDVDRRDPGIAPERQYDAHGVDLTLLRWTLSMTPLERLRQMERAARDTKVLNELGRRNLEAGAGPDR